MRLLSMFTGPSLMACGVHGVNLTVFVRSVEDVYYGLVRIIPCYHSLQHGPVQYLVRCHPFQLVQLLSPAVMKKVHRNWRKLFKINRSSYSS